MYYRTITGRVVQIALEFRLPFCFGMLVVGSCDDMAFHYALVQSESMKL